eukprot:3944950-Amphidinium_carterae.2
MLRVHHGVKARRFQNQLDRLGQWKKVENEGSSPTAELSSAQCLLMERSWTPKTACAEKCSR